MKRDAYIGYVNPDGSGEGNWSEQVVGYVPAHSLYDELPPERPVIEPIVTGWREVWSIIWQTAFVAFLWITMLYALPVIFEWLRGGA